MGSDGSAIGGIGDYFLFQFTLPHGERRERHEETLDTVEFQFTLPHGERHLYNFTANIRRWFQFTLPHGERQRSAVM